MAPFKCIAALLLLMAAVQACSASGTCETAQSLLQRCAQPVWEGAATPASGCCPLAAAFHLRGCLQRFSAPRGPSQVFPLRALSLACTADYPSLAGLTDTLQRLWAAPEEEEEEADPALALTLNQDDFDAGAVITAVLAQATQEAAAQDAAAAELLYQLQRWVDAEQADGGATAAAQAVDEQAQEAADVAAAVAALRNLALASRDDFPDMFDMAEAAAVAAGDPNPVDRPSLLRRRPFLLRTVTLDVELSSPAKCSCGAAAPPPPAGASPCARLAQRWAAFGAAVCCFSCEHPYALLAVMAAQVAVALAAAACLFAARAVEESGPEQFLSSRSVAIEDASDPYWADMPLLVDDDEEERHGVFKH